MTERMYYSVKEWCEQRSISRATFYRLGIPYVKLGRKTLVPATASLPTTLPTPRSALQSNGGTRPETSKRKYRKRVLALSEHRGTT